MRKGTRVLLKGSAAKKYKNYQAAWIDLAGKTTDFYRPVLVMKQSGGYAICRVAKDNVVTKTAPMNRTAAAFQQHPKLDELMNSLCNYLAKCMIDRTHDNGWVVDRFSHTLDRAVDKLSSNPTASIKRVEWPIES